MAAWPQGRRPVLARFAGGAFTSDSSAGRDAPALAAPLGGNHSAVMFGTLARAHISCNASLKICGGFATPAMDCTTWISCCFSFWPFALGWRTDGLWYNVSPTYMHVWK